MDPKIKNKKDSLLKRIREIYYRYFGMFSDDEPYDKPEEFKKYCEEVSSLFQTKDLDLMEEFNPDGKYILFYLLYDPLVPTLEYLFLNINLDINIIIDEHSDFTPLYYTASWGQTKCVKFLLDKGALINGAPTYHRHTPLVIASVNRHEEVVKLLLQNGASIDKSIMETYHFSPSIKQIILEHQELPS